MIETAKNATRTQAIAPGLYVAATPIGNLRDVSLRLLDTMKSVDAILCEDTRHTAKLCTTYGITTKRRPYHEHNAASVRPQIIEALINGTTFCLVSDAGTPLIADPGYKLISEAQAADIPVYTIPGPSAVTAALSISGLPTDRFLFAGFPPNKPKARETFLQDIASVSATLVFYETPVRLASTLAMMASIFGNRPACVARELTKRHESLNRGRLGELARAFETENTKGEIVVIVGPPEPNATTPQTVSSKALDAFLEKALPIMSVRDASTIAADALGIPKKHAYARALELNGKNS